MYLATNILKVDVNAVRAVLLQGGGQIFGGFVVEGCIVPKPLLQQLHL